MHKKRWGVARGCVNALYRRDGRTGRLRIAYDVIDLDVPYVRRIQGDLVAADAGRWTDLAPDFPAPPGDGEDAVRWLQQHARDGEVRARMMDLGISKGAWESSSSQERRAVIDFVHAGRLTEAAVQMAITHQDPRLRARAVELLRKLTRVLGQETNIFNNKGFGPYAFKDTKLAIANQVVVVIEHLLAEAKREAAAAKQRGQDRYRDRAWVQAHADRINAMMLERIGSPKRARCAPEQIRLLASRTQPRTIARGLVVEAFPDLTEEDLRRTKPRRRGRRKTATQSSR